MRAMSNDAQVADAANGPVVAHAAVARATGAPVSLEEILLDPPGPGELRVRVTASGVCHTDLNARNGNFVPDFPILLGHEAAGVVEAVGPGVTRPRVGETVVLNWRAPCGECRACLAGRTPMCPTPAVAKPRMRTKDGKTLSRVLGLGTFATRTIVHAAQAVPVPADIPPEVACLLGCGVLTGVGAALYAAPVEAGSAVAVIGCGAVGMSVIQGARLRRAAKVIAVDLHAAKLEQARRFGATDVVDASAPDATRRIRELSGGGVAAAFDCVGIPATLQQAMSVCHEGGTAVLIGMPVPRTELPLSLTKFFYTRATLKATFFGDGLATRDFPLLCGLYQRGELLLDELVTAKASLADLDGAFAAMERGETLRTVITFPA
jgi:S-(hydroxymethyl)mycothiol dehydrogenase